MKKVLYIIFAMLPILVACNPEEITDKTDRVELSMKVVQVSAAFCQVQFTTNTPAYYLIGIQKVVEGVDPFAYEKQFKNLTLDSAYLEYIGWRHDLLLDGVHDIAEFKHHGLQYCDADRYFQFLSPDTDYWVFCYVVDADRNKPAGKLVLQTIHTEPESVVPMQFDYRINGRWDYVYPKNNDGTLLTNVPWVGATIDSLTLREMNARVPGEFFADTFAIISMDKSARVLYGVYSHNNDGYGDGTSDTNFEKGHTYYTGLASLDGPVLKGKVPKYFDIFRFRWDGDSTKVYLTHDKDNTGGAW